ncbi:hypothetical protein HN51_040325 [Arachis hypogaea]
MSLGRSSLFQEMGFAFHKGWKKMFLAAESAEERMENEVGVVSFCCRGSLYVWFKLRWTRKKFLFSIVNRVNHLPHYTVTPKLMPLPKYY